MRKIQKKLQQDVDNPAAFFIIGQERGNLSSYQKTILPTPYLSPVAECIADNLVVLGINDCYLLYVSRLVCLFP